MECKVCGTLNAEDAIFCKQCGVRIDGKKACKACGAENDYDAKFCNKCGASFSGEALSTATVAESQEITLEAVKPSNWKRILEIIGWAFAMTGLFFAFLFTFFIGIEGRALGGSTSSNGYSVNLFQYLSKAFENFENDVANMLPERFAVTYVPIFLTTLIAVSVLITVLVLTIVSIVRFVKYVKGKREKDFANVTIAAYLVFVMGSIMWLGLNSLHTRYVSMTLTVSGGDLMLSSANTAGIVLGGLCMLAFVGLRVAVKGKQLALKENILKIVFCGVFVLISCGLLGLLPNGAISVKNTDSYETETISGSFFTILSMLYATNGTDTDALIIATFAHLTQIVMIILVITSLLKQLENTLGTKTKSTLGFSITTFVLAVNYLILTIVFNSCVFGESQTEVNVVYTIPVVILIFAALNLAAAITHVAMTKKVQTVESTSAATVSE